ncbi:hypothetical protein Q3G72_008934 [Acer saccharum]|nr:hypothetical protein Q3G72_008934 [Acer saccharum]
MRPIVFAVLCSLIAASGCTAPAPQRIGGTITGLAGTLSITNNGLETLVANSNGPFVFATPAQHYDVVVAIQPTGQICQVAHGSGTAQNVPITDIVIACETDANGEQSGSDKSTDDALFSVGGSIAGLTGTVVLQQGTDFVFVSAPQTTFSFPPDLADGSRFAIVVAQQPDNQTCTLNTSRGTIDAADVSNLTIVCVAAKRTLSFHVEGSAGPVSVVNNGTDAYRTSADGNYTFATAQPDGAHFNVSVLEEPSGQACIVDNGYGMFAGTDVNGINVNCQNPIRDYTVGGTAAGIVGPVELNNGIENITVTQDGPFTFPSPLISASTYNVSIVSQPAGQACAVTTVAGDDIYQSGEGQAYSDITTLQINCTAGFSIGGSVANLAPGGTLRLVNNNDMTDVATISANGNYTFASRFDNHSPYEVSIITAPPNQTCTLSNNFAGSINNASAATINVSCSNAATSQYTVGGTISGLHGTATLTHAGIESLVVSANGNAAFTFPTAMLNAAPYNVSVSAAPTNQVCHATAFYGVINNHNVNTIVVKCVAGQSIDIAVSGLVGTAAIENTMGPTAIAANTNTVTMPGVFDLNAYVALNVATAPSHQRCVLLNASGTLAAATLAPALHCGPSYAFINGQNAKVVIGQPDMFRNSCTAIEQLGAQNLCSPYKSAYLSATDELFVADSRNNRVLKFASIPQSNAASPSLVLGQADFTGANAHASPTGLAQPSALGGDGNHLVVADTNNNRVLIYVPTASANQQAANVVVGQTNFTANTAACTATNLNHPQGVTISANKLVVADTDNHRVLIYNTIPTAANQPADIVLGQADMATCLASSAAPSAHSLNSPTDVWTDGNTLLIADKGNNRIVVFANFPQQTLNQQRLCWANKMPIACSPPPAVQGWPRQPL